jgi:hypothetical protein
MQAEHFGGDVFVPYGGNVCRSYVAVGNSPYVGGAGCM